MKDEKKMNRELRYIRVPLTLIHSVSGSVLLLFFSLHIFPPPGQLPHIDFDHFKENALSMNIKSSGAEAL